MNSIGEHQTVNGKNSVWLIKVGCWVKITLPAGWLKNDSRMNNLCHILTSPCTNDALHFVDIDFWIAFCHWFITVKLENPRSAEEIQIWLADEYSKYPVSLIWAWHLFLLQTCLVEELNLFSSYLSCIMLHLCQAGWNFLTLHPQSEFEATHFQLLMMNEGRFSVIRGPSCTFLVI